MSSDDKLGVPGYHREIAEPFNIHDLHAPIMREQNEPRDGFEPIPPGFAPFFGLLVFWAGFYFAGHYANFDPSVLSGAEWPPRAGEGADKEPTLAERGGRVFSGTCASCHGPDGAGVSCPPLAKSEWVQDKPPGVIVRIVMHGLTGPVQVKDKSYNLNMKVDVPDAEIAAAATFVRQAWGNTPRVAGDVTPEFVLAVRKKVGARATQWTAAELDAVDDSDIPFGAPKPPEKDKK